MSLIFQVHLTSKRQTRKKKIIWFNPKQCKRENPNVKTNVGKIFMRLVDKHFPRHHKCYKLFDRNNIKLSYSCIPNLNNVIRKHNSKLGKIQHHQSPKLAIAFKKQTVLWMGTVLLNALFTKHLLVQLLINITMLLVKILSKSVTITIYIYIIIYV